MIFFIKAKGSVFILLNLSRAFERLAHSISLLLSFPLNFHGATIAWFYSDLIGCSFSVSFAGPRPALNLCRKNASSTPIIHSPPLHSNRVLYFELDTWLPKIMTFSTFLLCYGNMTSWPKARKWYVCLLAPFLNPLRVIYSTSTCECDPEFGQGPLVFSLHFLAGWPHSGLWL